MKKLIALILSLVICFSSVSIHAEALVDSTEVSNEDSVMRIEDTLELDNTKSDTQVEKNMNFTETKENNKEQEEKEVEVTNDNVETIEEVYSNPIMFSTSALDSFDISLSVDS